MSTKVYNAWKMPTSKIAAFVSLMDEIIIEAAVTHLLSMINSAEPKEMAKQIQQMLNLSVRSSLSLRRSFEKDLNCSMVFWIVNRRTVLFRAFGENWFLKAFNKALPDYVKNYYYQNSTDRPKDVSPQAWNARKRAWEDVYGRNGSRQLETMLVHEFIDFRPPGGINSEIRFIVAVEKELNIDTTKSMLFPSTDRPIFVDK